MSAAMKSSHPVRPCGGSPVSLNSIRAEVLARMLAGEHMTSMDAVFNAGTTRLAAVVHVLSREYGWIIERDKLRVACKDGHIATVTSYSLSKETIKAARAEGADEWLSVVHAIRDAKRMEAAQRSRRRDGTPGEFATF